MSPRFVMLELSRVTAAGSEVRTRLNVDCPAEQRAFGVRLVFDRLRARLLVVRAECYWRTDLREHALTDADDEQRRALERLCEDWPEMIEALLQACADEEAAEDHDYGCDCRICQRERHARERANFAQLVRTQRERLSWVFAAEEEE